MEPGIVHSSSKNLELIEVFTLEICTYSAKKGQNNRDHLERNLRTWINDSYQENKLININIFGLWKWFNDCSLRHIIGVVRF